MPKTTPDFYKLKRYLIAYDGDIVTDFNQANATHFIHDPQAEVRKEVNFSHKFIKDSQTS